MINSGFSRTVASFTPLALVLCATSSALAQGTTCATATPVMLYGTYSGNTNSGIVSTTTTNCASSSGNKALWYSYTPAASGEVWFDTCSATTTFDTTLAVYNACGGTQLGCDDDSCFGANRSRLMVNLNSGTTYYIRVSGWSGAVGAYTLSVSPPPPPPPPPVNGPDVTIWSLTDYGNYGSVGTVTAFAIGTTSYNAGDAPVDWRDDGTNNKAPVIAQNIYKLKGGRFTQMGQSWLKHGFASTNSGGVPGGCTQPPLGDNQLGINCLDTYNSGYNGGQGNLGPRSAVNATSGYYPPVINNFSSGDAIFKRLQIQSADIEATDAIYFGEAYYVTYDDACWGNALNNCTYSQITTPGATINNIGTLYRRDPAILAWGRADPSVVTVNADHTYTLMNFGAQGDSNTFYPALPRDNTCRYIAASKVTNNGNGTWHYEYCVYNHNSDRSGYSFSLHLPAGANTSGEGMSFPRSHSGEPYTNATWTADKSQPGMLTFKADADYAANPNANAIRWGTMYTFWFDANVAPMAGQGKVALFKPTYDGSHLSAPAPAGRVARDLALAAYANGLQVPHYCPADIATTGGALGPDGATTVDDLVAFLAQFFAGNLAVADIATLGGGSGTAGDGQLTADDLVFFLTAFFSNCN